jgi:hypothetical protein
MTPKRLTCFITRGTILNKKKMGDDLLRNKHPFHYCMTPNIHGLVVKVTLDSKPTMNPHCTIDYACIC